jgi:hypothetical protein
MTATVAQFRELLPGFTAVPDETIQLYLDIAADMMGDGWGEVGDEAQCFLAAHLMSMAGIGPGAQASQLAGFTNIKAGSLSLSREVGTSMGGYGSSPYGQIFWAMWQGHLAVLKRAVGTGIMVTGTGAAPPDGLRYNHGYAPWGS